MLGSRGGVPAGPSFENAGFGPCCRPNPPGGPPLAPRSVHFRPFRALGVSEDSFFSRNPAISSSRRVFFRKYLVISTSRRLRILGWFESSEFPELSESPNSRMIRIFRVSGIIGWFEDPELSELSDDSKTPTYRMIRRLRVLGIIGSFEDSDFSDDTSLPILWSHDLTSLVRQSCWTMLSCNLHDGTLVYIYI